jgi:hypothetical protein
LEQAILVIELSIPPLERTLTHSPVENNGGGIEGSEAGAIPVFRANINGASFPFCFLF